MAVVGLVSVVVSACAVTYPRYEPSSEWIQPNHIDRTTCKEEGGQITRVCMSRFKACITRYKDAGSPCRNSSECVGLCVSDIDLWPEPGTPTDGRCQINDDPCGCFVEVSDARVQEAWCFD